MAKPNGLEQGIIGISIDDGYVEYLYHIKPDKDYSIDQMHKKICTVLGAKTIEEKIRTSHIYQKIRKKKVKK